VTQRDIKEKLVAAIDYLGAHPDEAHYTDSVATATLSDPDGLRVEVNGTNGERITTDMPKSVGGGDAGPSPGWYLRAAEASCVATLIAMRAAQEGVAFEGLEVSVDSESDDRGILGIDETIPAGPLHTRVQVKVSALHVDDEDDSVWQSIVEWAVEHCPVTDAVRRAVPLTYEILTDEDAHSQ
jgi:uncharacterized OsmC-like protein